MLRTLIFCILICIASVAYGHEGATDRTNSPAYHGRHYSRLHYSPRVRSDCYPARPRVRTYYPPVYVAPRINRFTPNYTPYDYYGYPYGAYRYYAPLPTRGFHFQLRVR